MLNRQVWSVNESYMIILDDMTVNIMTLIKMTADEMTTSKTTVDEMSSDKMTEEMLRQYNCK